MLPKLYTAPKLIQLLGWTCKPRTVTRLFTRGVLPEMADVDGRHLIRGGLVPVIRDVLVRDGKLPPTAAGKAGSAEHLALIRDHRGTLMLLRHQRRDEGARR